MSEPSRPSPATAGTTLVASIAAGALLGYGAGQLVGVTALLVIVGVFVGLVVGFAIVFTRFRNI